jgi:hypothetical protein
MRAIVTGTIGRQVRGVATVWRSATASPRAGAAAAVAAIVAIGATPALAQPRDPAAAEELFRAGLAALDGGDWDGACSRFEASMRLDPSAGTSINVARCLEHEGRLAAAWAELERARVLAREEPDQRRLEVEAFVDAAVRRLEPRIPRLRITATALPPGARILRDGIPLAEGALGVPLPVDPGGHVVEATAPGHRPGRWDLEVPEGRRADVAVQLEPIPTSAFSAPDDVFAPTAPPRDAGPRPGLVAGVVLAGVGVAGLAVGAVAGAGAIDADGDIGALGCDGDALTCPSASSRDLAQSISDRGSTMATVSTVSFVAGGLLAAAGVTLIVLDGTAADRPVASARLAPLASAAGAGVALRGALW